MVDVSKIEKIMLLMAKHDFDVVEAQGVGEKISLARRVSQAGIFHPSASSSTGAHHVSLSSAGNAGGGTSSSAAHHAHEAHASTSASESSSAAAAAKPIPAGEVVTSPFVGTFYRSPGPDAPHFVEIGSRVKKGQSLCIVEAMKLMNEIESEFDGEVVAILHDNAKPVEFGTPLFVIAPSK